MVPRLACDAASTRSCCFASAIWPSRSRSEWMLVGPGKCVRCVLACSTADCRAGEPTRTVSLAVVEWSLPKSSQDQKTQNIAAHRSGAAPHPGLTDDLPVRRRCRAGGPDNCTKLATSDFGSTRQVVALSLSCFWEHTNKILALFSLLF